MSKTYTFREPHPMGGWSIVEIDEKDAIDYMRPNYPEDCNDSFLLDEFKIIYLAEEYNSEEDKLKSIIDYQRRFIDHLQSSKEDVLKDTECLEYMITYLLNLKNDYPKDDSLESKIKEFIEQRKESRIFTFTKRLKLLQDD